MIEIEHTEGEDVIVVRISGTLTVKDYDYAVPEIEHAVKLAQGPLHVMIRLEDFQGWEIGALWKDLRFDVEHRGDFGRIAVLGETQLEEWATRLSAPFASSEMKFFPLERNEEASAWLANG
ncbi:STAS/SEC14 domain-containing protein [Roseovarius sp.]|uniref:STAS/SEC14 domain-containing protein n=1 Tax=Roseovarius sp. TaxID=1486281 RepID=UPI0035635126